MSYKLTNFLVSSLLSIFVSLNASAQVSSEQLPRDISVTAEARAYLPADAARVTVLLESSAASAEQAEKGLEPKINALTQAVGKLGAKLALSTRGQNIRSAVPGKDVALSKGATTRALRYLVIETTSLDRVSAIIEAALNTGATSVPSVDYYVQEQSPAQLAAVKLATERAKQKAALVAQSLGVTLGPLLSAAVTEEPEGAVMREQMQFGQSVNPDYSEKQVDVFVNLRFEVIN